MKQAVVVIGMGEMGSVFARAFLKQGHPVYPVLRGQNMEQVTASIPPVQCVVLAVAEADLADTLKKVPQVWHHCLCLLQNELLPRDWKTLSLPPSVISVWFEKKKGQDVKVLLPSPVYGGCQSPIIEALASLGIPTKPLADSPTLTYELVLKNLYILSTNIAGLITGGTTAQLKSDHLALARTVAEEVLQIQQWLCGESFDWQMLWQDLLTAYDSDPDHQCTGRAAPVRLERALAFADEAGLAVPQCRQIASKAQVGI